MNWINPKFVERETLEGGHQHAAIFLADDPEDCFLGSRIDGTNIDGTVTSFHFPEKCSRIATALMTEGTRLELVRASDILPYDETVAVFERLNRSFIIGRSWQGHFYIHCKLSDEYGLLAAF